MIPFQHAHAANDHTSTFKELKEQMNQLRQQNVLHVNTVDLLAKNKPSETKDTSAPGAKAISVPRPSQHCWTHGANLSHKSKECQFKRNYYEDNATFKDRMGGSKYDFGRKEVKELLPTTS